MMNDDAAKPGAGKARNARLSSARLIDAGECACSVALAIAFAHLLHAGNVSWAAVSGYMVMRGHVSDSLLRGILRIAGTLVGAGLALLIVPALVPSVAGCSIVGGAIGGGALYGAITGKRAYGWLFLGPDVRDGAARQARTSCRSDRRVRVHAYPRGLCRHGGVPRRQHDLHGHRPTALARHAPSGGRRIGWHPQAARHAAQAAVALAMLPWLWSLFAVPQLAQSAVTVMAAMLVPVSSVGTSGFVPVTRRLLQRVAGCLAGAAMAAAFLFGANGSAPVLFAGTIIGVIAGKLLENGPASTAYIGLQFTIAILVTLVPDSYAAAAVSPAVERLTGILIGMALLEPILFLWHVVQPAGRASATVAEALPTSPAGE